MRYPKSGPGFLPVQREILDARALTDLERERTRVRGVSRCSNRGIRLHLDTQHEPRHVIAGVGRVRLMTGGIAGHWKVQRGIHVKEDVAMKQPVAGLPGCPGHRDGFTGLHGLGCNDRLIRIGYCGVRAFVAFRADVEVSPVQVHRVDFVARIDDAPVDRAIHRINEPFRRRPRLPVEHPQFRVREFRPGVGSSSCIQWPMTNTRSPGCRESTPGGSTMNAPVN